MSSFASVRLRAFISAAALGAALPLAACNQPAAESALSAQGLPDLPATMPLALGEPTQPVYAPAGYDMPAAPLLPAAQVADPGDYYAYADDAYGYEDSLAYAPPDYGFYYDEVEPWAWQGYDDSLMFVEPLEVGYRTYFYRPGDEYPYYIRDPDCGYGYDGGRLVAVYDSYGAIIPYADYGPRYAYASRYYRRGHDLYWASRQRHPVIAANWIERRPVLTSGYREWQQDRSRQPAWRAYHDRIAGQSASHWQPERARRQADAVRFAAWRDQGFRTAAPPRAIPAGWQRAKWARDERRFAPPADGFLGDGAERRQAAVKERTRVAALAADHREQVNGAAAARQVALVQRHAERRAEATPAFVRPQEVNSERRDERREMASRQVEPGAMAPARDHDASAALQERRQAQAEERAAAERRQQAQARQQTEARRAEVDQRQRVRAEQRQQAQVQASRQADARQEAQARRTDAEQRQRAQTEARQVSRTRQQAARDQAEVRAAERNQQPEQRRQEARAEPPQREARPERVAQTDASPRGNGRERRQR